MIPRYRTAKFFTLLPAVLGLWLSACNTIDLYEKAVAIPAREWSKAYKPQFSFIIKDTTAQYQVYLLLRHNNQYRYNNIWVNLYAQAPGDTAKKKVALELPLANKEGWLGSGMDDIYDHRIPVTLNPQTFSFARSGSYTFTLEQIMRDDPLPNVLNAGIRVEKKPL